MDFSLWLGLAENLPLENSFPAEREMYAWRKLVQAILVDCNYPTEWQKSASDSIMQFLDSPLGATFREKIGNRYLYGSYPAIFRLIPPISHLEIRQEGGSENPPQDIESLFQKGILLHGAKIDDFSGVREGGLVVRTRIERGDSDFAPYFELCNNSEETLSSFSERLASFQYNKGLIYLFSREAWDLPKNDPVIKNGMEIYNGLSDVQLAYRLILPPIAAISFCDDVLDRIRTQQHFTKSVTPTFRVPTFTLQNFRFLGTLDW